MLTKFLNVLLSGTPYVAYLSLLIALINLIFSYIKLRKERFNIIVEHNHELLFPPIDTSLGNRYSLTLLMKITNLSTEPIQISDIQLAMPNGFFESCVKKPIDATAKEQSSDGYTIITFDDIATMPRYLNRYEEIEGRILFLRAGSEYDENLNKVKARIVTSRGNKDITLVVPSVKYVNSFFSQISPSTQEYKEQ